MKTTPLWLPVPLLATVTAASAPASVPPIIEDLVGEYTRQPMRVPSNQTVGAPILGNGEFGVVVGGQPADNNLTFFLGSNQFWSAPTSGISQCGFRDGDNLYFELGGGGGVRQIGGVTITAPGFVNAARAKPEQYRAWQRIANATVRTRHTRGTDGRALLTESYVHADHNLLITRIRIENSEIADRKGRAEPLRIVVWTVGSGIGPAHSYPNKQIRLPPNISDPSLIPACAFPTRAGCLSSSPTRASPFIDGASACKDGAAVFGAAVSRMAGFPFQQTPHTNVTVIAAAAGAFIRSPTTSPAQGSGGPKMSTTVAVLRDIVAERGSSGGDRVSFTVDLAADDELLLTTALVSNRDADWADPVQAAAKIVRGLGVPSAIERLDRQHRQWWAEYWSKSYVHIETDRPKFDQGVHRFYYGALHVLASASRSGKVAPGLYGPFVTCDHMLWGDDFHLNYNFQAAFYGAVGSNRPELADSFFSPVLNHVPIARTNARNDFGCPGVVFDGAIGPRGMLATHVGDMGQRSDAAFAAVNFVSRWLYTRDTAFLVDDFGTGELGWARTAVTPYDLLKDIAAFWSCHLVRNSTTGVYELDDVNDCVGEVCQDNPYGLDVNPVGELALLRYALAGLIDASVALGRDVSLRAKWTEMLCHLAPYPAKTLPDGGGTVFLEVIKRNSSIAPAVTPASSAGIDSSMAIWPGGATAPALDRCAMPYPTVQKMIRNGLSNTSETFGGDSYQTPAAAVYARYNKTALYPALERGLQPCTESCNAMYMCGELCLHPSLYLDQHNGGGLETAGAIEWVHAMLLQSRDGVLRVFPWLPDGTRAASFVRLRALGAFLVSANYTATSGVVSPVLIKSEAKQQCVMEALEGWAMKNVTVCIDLKSVQVRNSVDELGRTVWSWATERQGNYHVHKGVVACS